MPSPSPQVGDFSGALTVAHPSTSVGSPDRVLLSIRNVTNHVVEAASGTNPHSVAIVCAPDLTSDGNTARGLVSNTNLFFMVAPPLAPGEQFARSGDYLPTAADIGTVTCAGVIVASETWVDGTVRVVGRITEIPPVSFTVTAGDASDGT